MNHLGELVRRHGDELAQELGLSVKDLDHQSLSTTSHGDHEAERVSDDLAARFGILGDASAHIAKLAALENLGVTDVTLYLNHDCMVTTMDTYITEVIPQFRAQADGGHPSK